MSDTKFVYRMKESSKGVIVATVLICLSAVIRYVFSNFGFFAVFGWSQAVIAVLEFLFAATIIAVYKKKIPFTVLEVAPIIWAFFHFLCGNKMYSSFTIELLVFTTGIFLLLMGQGILSTKIFSSITSILTIIVVIIRTIVVFIRFFMVDFFHDDIFPSTSDVLNFAIVEVRNIGCLLVAIGITLIVGALCLKEIPITKKRDTPHLSNTLPPVSASNNKMEGSKKFCSHCGKEIMIQAVICPHCGCSIATSAEYDIPSKGLNILSFFIPLVGLVLYCLSHDKTPNKAKEIGKWAIIGFAVGVGGSVILIILNEILWNL